MTASLELSRELYKLSGWEFRTHYWIDNATKAHTQEGYPCVVTAREQLDKLRFGIQAGLYILWPAYDLGYLLRKLPPNFNTGDVRGSFEFFLKMTSREWFAGYNKPEFGKWLYDSNHGVYERPCNADTPEDAACKLAIELFKSGVLNIERNEK